MKAKFTPGPWSVVATGKVGLGEVVCEVGDGQNITPEEGSRYQIGVMSDWGGWDADVTLANARLIAAAPVLYETLQDIIGLAESGRVVHIERLAKSAIARVDRGVA